MLFRSAREGRIREAGGERPGVEAPELGELEEVRLGEGALVLALLRGVEEVVVGPVGALPTGAARGDRRVDGVLQGLAAGPEWVDPVTVVRDPYTRFVSSMRHFFEALNAQITHPHHVNHLIYSIPLNNTTNFCNFFYKFYDKNCISFDPMVHHKIAYHNIQMYHPFFQTQTSMIRTATNPLIFKYENLNEFNIWLETEIGIDTSKLSYVGKSEKIIPFNIDLESEEIKSLVKYLFEEDYVQFNYV